MDLISTGLKTAGMLCIVLGMLILVLYLMKRFVYQRRETKGDLAVKTLASLYLTAKERIEVIDIAGERIVLGVAPGNINYITRLKETEIQGPDPEDKGPERE